MPWYVLYTRSRSEKLVADGLRKRGIDVYCPLKLVKRQWSDRTKLVEEPLFRSYCFVNIDERDREQVFAVPGVVRYLFWLKKPAVVRQEEIDAIKDLLNDFDHESIEVLSFTPQDPIRFTSGVLSGQEGIVKSIQGRRLFVTISSLGITLSVDTTMTKIVKLASPAA